MTPAHFNIAKDEVPCSPNTHPIPQPMCSSGYSSRDASALVSDLPRIEARTRSPTMALRKASAHPKSSKIN
jgi:hypothetical protein